MVLLSNGFGFLQSNAASKCRLKYYTQTLGSVWDDEVSLTLSGATLWLDAYWMGVGQNSEDSLLLEQGKIAMGDRKVFVNGSIVLQTGSTSMKFQVGSPTGDNYFMISPGGEAATWGTTDIFKKFYIRRLTGGSLIGEV